MELFDLPLYAVQRLADGTWLVRSRWATRCGRRLMLLL
jgi:hypothetical protein